MTRRPAGPAESVDAFGGPVVRVDDVETLRERRRPLFLAAVVFAAFAWGCTAATAVFSSETNGVRASWFAIFPTMFGLVGLGALAGPRPRRALPLAVGAGFAGVAALWLFFVAIWPSL